MIEELSTAKVAPRDRLPFWNEIATRMVAPMNVQPMPGTAFSASLFRQRLHDCELLSPCSSPAQIASGAWADAGTLNLQLQHVGQSTNTTAGKSCSLNEGDFLLFDPSQPMRLEFTVPTQVLILRLPLAYAEDRLPRLRKMAGVKMQGDHGAGALFSSFLRKAWRQIASGETDYAESLGDVIWPLLDLAYAGERNAAPDPSVRDERRRALFNAVEQDLCDPDLDVHRIARRMGVSARYVQMLFAEIATTPTAYIQQQRLDLAGHRLARGGLRCSITDVAFDVGFNDLSSFCRAFRRRFDVAPREYRAGIRRTVAASAPALSS